MAASFVVPTCHRCHSHNVMLRRQILANEAVQVAWYCVDCGHWAERSPQWLPHAELTARLRQQGDTINDIPLVADYSGDHPCRICGRPGEYHHWWPQALSDECKDWTDWPTDYLCLEHHRQWHDHITPYLVNRRKGKAA